ncbi:flagellin N-terminal helical domain-containing protein [Campylobacter magnus]|uniref:flagellin N-terminal helical domain-containing protein n=1 Tax=Campylobacter magnus TaxID=3026462 RepID=UPI0023617BD3|nr:flagellin [Campylobacter magnus]MDD0855753.1 flagellin [Campylobacter magnus]
MSFRINTNITSLSSNNSTERTNKKLTASLEHLSSGLRINKAANDASGMTVADSLRSQASSLEQSIASGNDAIGILQTADYAMAEQIEIIDTIRVKAIQAANDFHTRDSRLAIHQDIMRLLEEFDNIANTTTFNGHKLLNGNFSNKNFQMGAYSNEIISITIPRADSKAVGHLSFATSSPLMYENTTDFAKAEWTFTLNHGTIGNEKLEFNFTGQDLLTQGFKYITDRVNAVHVETGIRASARSDLATPVPILGSGFFGPVDLSINGYKILSNATVQKDDADGIVLNAINSQSSLTGVTATIDNGSGRMMLNSHNGLPIYIKTNDNGAKGALGLSFTDPTDATKFLNDVLVLGELTFSKYGSIPTSYSITPANTIAKNQKGVVSTGISDDGKTKFEDSTTPHKAAVNLHDFLTEPMSGSLAKAMGHGVVGTQGSNVTQEPGVLTYNGSQTLIDIAVVALGDLDRIRSNIGSIQNQITATINNISVTHLNIKAAESQIRDVDFANEVAQFNKQNILSQSGSYASAQANQIQQAIIRLLQ